MKLVMVLLMGLSVTACSTIDPYVTKAKEVAVESGQYVGLIDQSKMTVPEYYSTKTLPKNYQPGRVIYLDDLSCGSSGRCK